jgi:hypothetical protein
VIAQRNSPSFFFALAELRSLNALRRFNGRHSPMYNCTSEDASLGASLKMTKVEGHDEKKEKSDLHVQPPSQKYFRSLLSQITCTSFAIPARTEGRFAIVTDVGQGMRWTLMAH